MWDGLYPINTFSANQQLDFPPFGYDQVPPFETQYDYGYQQPQQAFQGYQQQFAQDFQQSQQQSAQSNQQAYQGFQQPQQQSTLDEEESGKKSRKARKYRTFALNFQVNNPDCFEDNAKLNVQN